MKYKIVLSFDDGKKEDCLVWSILNKYKLRGIFYLPNNTDLDVSDIYELSKKHEIGGHTVSHPSDLKLLSDSRLKGEIEDNKRWLENITGQKVTKFCYPRGRHDERVRKAVKDAGYKEARTTIVLSTTYPVNKFVTDTTIHFSYPRQEYVGHDWFELANDYLEKVIKYGGRFEIWGHSREAIQHKVLDKFEKMCSIIASVVK